MANTDIQTASDLKNSVYPNSVSQIMAGTNILKFPEDMADKVAISFLAKEVNTETEFEKAYEQQKNRVLGKNEKRVTFAQSMLDAAVLKAGITLPIPNSLNEDTRHSWGQEKSFTNDVVDKLTKTSIGKMVAKATKVANEIGANSGVRGVTTDPGFYQKYSGTEPRDFSMSWDFMITSSKDAEKIFNILSIFKTFSAPSQFGSNIALIAPNFWIVFFHNAKIRESTMIQPCVIKSVSLDYGAGGQFEVYKDGTPKFMKLSIVLSEIAAITRQAYGYDDPNAILDPETQSSIQADKATGTTSPAQ